MEQRPAPIPRFPDDTVLSRDHGRLKRLLGALRKAPEDAAARAAYLALRARGHRRDIALKGSGQTPFSRRGDGKATLGPVLREYLIGEAMTGRDNRPANAAGTAMFG